MFEVLMRNGNYRVDYLNPKKQSLPQSLGFYVRGVLPKGEAYAREVKRRLYAGMLVIERELGLENLVSVYMDVDRPENLRRPAYQQMKQDLVEGKIHRVFTYNLNDLAGADNAAEDLCRLFQEVGGFDLVSYDNGELTSTLFCYEPSGSQLASACCLAA